MSINEKLKEEIIIKYFSSWKENKLIIQDVFSSDIIYSECFGPIYNGIDQLISWFKEWNNNGRVLVWDVKQFIHSNNKTVVEWNFKCTYDNEECEFDGVSIIEFDLNNKIKSLKEFKSKSEHIYPYEER